MAIYAIVSDVSICCIIGRHVKDILRHENQPNGKTGTGFLIRQNEFIKSLFYQKDEVCCWTFGLGRRRHQDHWWFHPNTKL